MIDVCEYVSRKLGINITSCGRNVGSVIWADENAREILENQQIVKLVYKGASLYTFRAMNWSYSKGDTVDEACIILTDDFDNLADEHFSVKGVSPSTLNKLYVAMTRSSSNIYLIKGSTFKNIKEIYYR